MKKYRKVTDHWHYTDKYRDAKHSICNLKYSMPKEITIIFRNVSNCDNHFIIKKLAQ